MAKAILYDATKCTACKGCQVACKQWNQLPARHGAKRWEDLPVGQRKFTGSYQNPAELEPETWLLIAFDEKKENDEVTWRFARRSCMHCADATCQKVCPVGAISHTDEGFVVIDQEKCVGCRYCNYNCPFQIPKYDEANKLGSDTATNNKTWKCRLCQDRITNGVDPACVTACPTGALMYDDRDKVIAEAESRMSKMGGNGETTLYGKDELDGLHVLYILADDPERYGLPKDPRVPVSAILWKDILKPLGPIAGGAAVAAFIISFLANLGYKREAHGEEGGAGEGGEE